jgi:hypothetical protein
MLIFSSLPGITELVQHGDFDMWYIHTTVMDVNKVEVGVGLELQFASVEGMPHIFFWIHPFENVWTVVISLGYSAGFFLL